MTWAACAAPPATYATVSLVDLMEGEERGEVWGTKVAYLDPDEAAAYRVDVRDGILVNADGSPLHTGDRGAIFVMTADGRFFATLAPPVGRFHHSSFVAGAPVAAAGELVVQQGRLEVVSDKSGHYRPDEAKTVQALHELGCRGIDLLNVTVELTRTGVKKATLALAEARRRGQALPSCR